METIQCIFQSSDEDGMHRTAYHVVQTHAYKTLDQLLVMRLASVSLWTICNILVDVMALLTCSGRGKIL